MSVNFQRLRDRVFQLAERIVAHESDGVLRADGHRLMLLSARAFGFFRADLIHTLGRDCARGLLKRLGYQAGYHDGAMLVMRHPELSTEEQMLLGTMLHQKEGMARIETDLEKTVVDLENGVLQIRSRWFNSLEAEQHVNHFGHAAHTVCWMLSGYASGHLSFLLKRQVLAQELHCAGEGHDCCEIQVGFAENLSDTYPQSSQDYKPIDLGMMHHDLGSAGGEQDLIIQQLQRSDSKQSSGSAFDRIVGESVALCNSIDIARAVSRVDSTVLITGESGTGKEVFARCIQEASLRGSKPFLTVNCATLTESLQNAELFGYVKGAFTGAVVDRAGLFEQADRGTLFLDEIGELSASAQAALLRVLQEGKIKRVGDTRERDVDVRIIVATHRDLEGMIETGAFREDLYYRLNVISFEVPPLRSRDNDILLLARYFIEMFNRRFERDIQGISAEAKHRLLAHCWPGNVRELRNAIERAALLATGNMLQVTDFPPNIALPANDSVDHAQPKAGGERALLVDALHRHHFNRSETAKALGISRATLWRKMKKLGLG